jgi:alginate O-acetyltransferase complex protein AlgI
MLNYYVSTFLGILSDAKKRKVILIMAVSINLLSLVYFKYSGLLVSSTNSLLAAFGLVGWSKVPHIIMPIGISFYTFAAISYLVDVYKNRERPPTRLVDFMAYLAAFPVLLAGPILRLGDVREKLSERRTTIEDTFEGIVRFSSGLAKKVILADGLGEVAANVFKLPANELSMSIAWLGAVCYTLQIYYDFSGYTDMAIGLGRMIGFRYPENFDQPYRSKNITEFWRRWHITLTSWFRDYLYIPMGGNRKGNLRTYVNLFTVFLLCGLWHGASYTFLVWGLYHGVLLVGERILKNRYGFVPSGAAGMFVTNLLVMFGWVVFAMPSFPLAVSYISAMFTWSAPSWQFFGVGYYLTNDKATILCAAIVIALFPFESLAGVRVQERLLTILKGTLSLALLFISVIVMSTQTFKPFIYFQF